MVEATAVHTIEFTSLESNGDVFFGAYGCWGKCKFWVFCRKCISSGVSSFLERLITYFPWILEEVEEVTKCWKCYVRQLAYALAKLSCFNCLWGIGKCALWALHIHNYSSLGSLVFAMIRQNCEGNDQYEITQTSLYTSFIIIYFSFARCYSTTVKSISMKKIQLICQPFVSFPVWLPCLALNCSGLPHTAFTSGLYSYDWCHWKF